jgi:hypothetical protein
VIEMKKYFVIYKHHKRPYYESRVEVYYENSDESIVKLLIKTINKESDKYESDSIWIINDDSGKRVGCLYFDSNKKIKFKSF